MNRDDELNERLAEEILAMPIDAVRRELKEAGLHPVDAAEAYPEAFAYFAARAGVNRAANDDDERLVRMAAFDGSRGAPAAIGDAPGAGLLGQVAGAQGAAMLALRDGVVEIRLETPAAISRLWLGADDFKLSAVDGSGLIYTVIGLGEDTAYLFGFDHGQDPANHPVSWS